MAAFHFSNNIKEAASRLWGAVGHEKAHDLGDSWEYTPHTHNTYIYESIWQGSQTYMYVEEIMFSKAKPADPTVRSVTNSFSSKSEMITLILFSVECEVTQNKRSLKKFPQNTLFPEQMIGN